MAYRIIVVGTSWGGLSALRMLIGGLPADFAVPVAVVQHRHRESNHLLGSLLQDRTPLTVCEVEDKASIQPGNVYLAPADYHLLIEDGFFSLSVDEPVRYSRPSIDVTFTSAADSYDGHTVGIVLTGANSDGSIGLRRIADRGGLTIVQDPASAESPTMPAAAIRAVPTARVMEIPEIVRFLSTLPGPPAAEAPAPESRALPVEGEA
jgi:two-component system chemotaxis response regulator CheB